MRDIFLCIDVLVRVKLGYTPNFTFLGNLEHIPPSGWMGGWLVGLVKC